MNKPELEPQLDDIASRVPDAPESTEPQPRVVDAATAQAQRELQLRKGEELIRSLL